MKKWEILAAPLARVRGLGSAKAGVGHWWAQRWTGLLLVFLGLWFLAAMGRGMFSAESLTVDKVASAPLPAALLILFLLIGGYHAFLGLQVIIEDYVHAPWAKYGLLLFVKFLYIFMGILAIISLNFL